MAVLRLSNRTVFFFRLFLFLFVAYNEENCR